MSRLLETARLVAETLAESGRQLVLAESCTAGLVVASLGVVPGISRHLCGSAVVYQESTKAAWLGVPEALFASPGVVSADVAAAMTAGALARTPHANLAAAVTGHLGPGAPSDLDGVIYVAVQFRGEGPTVMCHRLTTGVEPDAVRARRERQREAAELVLDQLLAALQSAGALSAQEKSPRREPGR
jgi:PncC family amidohydrolase